MNLNLLDNYSNSNLNLLDWNIIFERFQKTIFLTESKKRIASEIFIQNDVEINHSFDSIDFILSNLESNREIIISNFDKYLSQDQNYLELITSISKNRILSITDLNYICSMIECSILLSSKLSDWNNSKLFKVGPDNLRNIKNNFIKKLRQFVDVDGTIYYAKHPSLSLIFKKISSLEEKIKEQIQINILEHNKAGRLQYPSFDIVNDHYVIPVKTDSFYSKIGKIIHRSSSGNTLFICPFDLLDLIDALLIEKNNLERELIKIASDFIKILQESRNIEYLKMLLNAITILDVDLSKAIFSSQHSLTRPTLSNSKEIFLEDFFNPLIEVPIKNTIHLPAGTSGLIISGPNTGGKTVALKAIAITHLFMHMGLFVPAKKAILSPLTNLYFLGDDQQSLEKSLSSFAAEATNYLHLLHDLGENNLIFIDEIFNTTSSDEASALALSILNEFTSYGKTQVIISSHHQILKTRLYDNPQYLSAHMEYDFKSNFPLFKIRVGDPGSSLALTIFEKLAVNNNFSTNFFENAKSTLENKHKLYESTLEKVSMKNAKLERLLESNRKINIDLKNQKKSMDGLICLEKEKIINSFNKKIKSITQDAKNILRDLSDLSKQEKRKYFTKLTEINNHFINQKPKLKNDKKEKDYISLPVEELIVGNYYFSNSLQKDVLFLKRDKKKNLVVKRKNISITVPLTDLCTSKTNNNVQTFSFTQKREGPSNINLDCRGLRLDEFKSIVDSAIENLMLEDIPYVNIIHGHGDGVLKSWLRKSLKDHRDFDLSFDATNDGQTTIKIKNC